ncbi:MAG: M42 family metallopeptidase [Anaerolineaceae bacterium]|nr:M42 family metallopeptidase [Anaerolineaceae bacterium]
MKELIKRLVEATGPSGYEKDIRELVKKEISRYADEIRVDALGNLIARKGKKTENGMRIMLSAHMDEIGIIATYVDENGFVRFTTMGAVRASTCIGGRVRFLKGSQGVISAERLESNEKTPTFEQLFIDVGASNPQDCPVRVGDVAAFDRPFVDLGNRLVSKAMDNRISVATLIEVMRQLKDSPHELFFVFSTQEEVGLRGATAAAFGVDPDLGFAVDITLTGDTPKTIKMEVSLGKGPAIKVRDSSMLADPRVVRWMVASAEKAKIPYQYEILEAGGTDAHAIQLTRMGVPAGCVSIPCRYVHSPSEMVDYTDVLNTVRLILELVSYPVHLA